MPNLAKWIVAFGLVLGIAAEASWSWTYTPPEKRIVFVLDTSGSMTDVIGFASRRVRLMMYKMDSSVSHTFTMLLFRGDEVIEFGEPGVKPATRENRHLFSDWIQEPGTLATHGRGDPTAALERAFSYEPHLIIFISDGLTARPNDGIDDDALLKRLDTLNEHKKVTINTIDFVRTDPRQTLREIARRHRGEYKFVSANDLKLPRDRFRRPD